MVTAERLAEDFWKRHQAHLRGWTANPRVMPAECRAALGQLIARAVSDARTRAFLAEARAIEAREAGQAPAREESEHAA